jgi:hypothetical protein
MTTQHILFLAGNIFDVVTTDDIEAYVKATFAMPQLIVTVEHKVGMNVKAAKAESIKLAKEAGIY